MSKLTIEVTTPSCAHCGRASTLRIEMTEAQQRAFAARRTPIQQVFPELAPPVREQLKSGTHPECWAAMLGIA